MPGVRRSVRALALAAGLVLASCSSGDDDAADRAGLPPATTPARATSTTEPAPAAPPALVAAERIDVPDVTGAAWRVTYMSQRVDGVPVEVTGLVVRPVGAAPPGGFPVVAWGHGTIGVGDACIQMNSFDGHLGIPALQQRLDAGYVVAATDYEGIGGPGPHPYLVAESEARSIFDIARVLPQIEGVDASTRVVLVGFSQGGHAVLAAAERRARLAPDLDVVGVAALATNGDLGESVRAIFRRRDLAEFGMLLAVGWGDTYPELEATDVIAPAGADAADAARDGKCLGELQPFLGDATVGDLWVQSPTALAPWVARVRENDLHENAIDLPVFVAGGGDDPLAVPSSVNRLVERLCGAGLAVDDHRYTGAGHGATVDASITDVHEWIAARFRGEVAPSSCA
ncbi:MAG TPA: alpha/beta fold hydrolase [Acidimicrobiia bacterium]|nr:alpha/beta fold hydrolase [Acidimicrobiia bacterium]